MEFKDYVKIIKGHRMLFFGVWALFVAFVFAWFFSQPQRYEAVMSIDIARQSGSGAENTNDYDYDQYYRLEADESFSETVVQWLGDPGVVNGVFADSKVKTSNESLGSFSKFFKAEKLAPNYVQVKYAIAVPADAGAIFNSTSKIISEKTDSLNSDSKDQNWFKTNFSGPVVAQKKLPFLPFLVGAVVGGLLLALFSVLFAHYWRE